MFAADGPGAPLALAVRPPGLERKPRRLEVARQPVVDAGAEDTGHGLVQLLRVPPAVRVGLAEAHGSLREVAGVQAVVVDLDVPGIGTIDRDPGGGKEPIGSVLVLAVRHRPGHPNTEVGAHGKRTRLLPKAQRAECRSVIFR